MTHEEAIEYITERYVTMSMCLTLDECRKHNKAISMAIEALKKQMPIKPNNKFNVPGYVLAYGICPSCGLGVNSDMRFCSECGQAIDWSVSE